MFGQLAHFELGEKVSVKWHILNSLIYSILTNIYGAPAIYQGVLAASDAEIRKTVKALALIGHPVKEADSTKTNKQKNGTTNYKIRKCREASKTQETI